MRQPLISVRGVCRIFPGPSPVRALDGVSFDINQGEYVAITGSSGSGKSTLLSILGCLDRPTSGSYRLFGNLVGALPDRRLSAIRGTTIGFVFQNYHLLASRSVLENVAMATLYCGEPKGRALKRAHDALKDVGLASKARSRSSVLSGGERQRVAIARAIAHRPALLLADEPTGNLDSGTSERTLLSIEAMRKGGMTIVLVTHEREYAMRASRRIVLQDGRVAGDSSER